MKSETSHVSSVPDVGISVKELLCELFSGFPLVLRIRGLSVSRESDFDEAKSLMRTLAESAESTSLQFRFWRGDAYRQLRARQDIGEAFTAWLKQSLTEQEYRELKCCGWVAGKWHETLRNDPTKKWEFYKRTKPGGLGKPPIPETKRSIPLVELSREVAGSVISFELASPNKTPFSFVVDLEVKP